ncbi:Protein TBATA, partial [Schistosoma japonicum]
MSDYIHDVMNHIPDYSGRHNPHPHRVTHFTGFLGLPVRIVNDPIRIDDNILLNQRKDDYSTSLELKKRINFPIGLSPSYYTDFLVNNSLKLNLKVNNDLSNRSWKSNHCLHHVPVGILPLSQTYRKIPQFDTINGLKYFTGLQNYSVRERPPLIGPLIESELSRIKDAKQSGEYLNKSKYTSLFNRQFSEHRMKWQNELGYLTGSILMITASLPTNMNRNFSTELKKLSKVTTFINCTHKFQVFGNEILKYDIIATSLLCNLVKLPLSLIYDIVRQSFIVTGDNYLSSNNVGYLQLNQDITPVLNVITFDCINSFNEFLQPNCIIVIAHVDPCKIYSQLMICLISNYCKSID